MTQNQIKILKLEKEIELLRSFVIGLAGRDREGQYRPSFVKRILKSLRQETPLHFVGSDSFLNQLNSSHD